ncbi:hypothetical protein [Fischerella sp. PCC 9605]|uniref:hypothetical protein n=1 Tax=Fischerella sp. PCC 9605 TaxID=1173024 RepID=UPI0004B39833|nr:hypothetical protein [Fischerella sp. PCC 9605]
MDGEFRGAIAHLLISNQLFWFSWKQGDRYFFNSCKFPRELNAMGCDRLHNF